MEHVTIVGAEDDLLVLATESGERFALPIDEVLRAELRRAKAGREDKAAPLAASPREIQAHIRAGMSAEEDWEFHQSIYRASGNPLFEQIIAAMHELFHRFWEHPLGVRDFGDASFPFHRTIYERVVARDPDGARAEALKLMATVENDLKRGAAQLKLPDRK
jgi:DNA-binding FadR family transcriptional regulator